MGNRQLFQVKIWFQNRRSKQKKAKNCPDRASDEDGETEESNERTESPEANGETGGATVFKQEVPSQDPWSATAAIGAVGAPSTTPTLPSMQTALSQGLMQTSLTTYDTLNKYSPSETDIKPYYLQDQYQYYPPQMSYPNF